MAALLLAAVLSPAGVAGVALAADHLVLAVLERELEEVEVDLGVGAALAAAAAEPEHQVQRRLLLDVVVGQRALVLQLLPGEDEPLLLRRDACKTELGKHGLLTYSNHKPKRFIADARFTFQCMSLLQNS